MTTTVDLRLKVPYSLLVAGSSGAGKSNVVLRLLTSGDKVSTQKFSAVYWCYAKNTKQPELWAKLQKTIKNLKFIGIFGKKIFGKNKKFFRLRRFSQQTNRKRRT